MGGLVPPVPPNNNKGRWFTGPNFQNFDLLPSWLPHAEGWQGLLALAPHSPGGSQRPTWQDAHATTRHIHIHTTPPAAHPGPPCSCVPALHDRLNAASSTYPQQDNRLVLVLCCSSLLLAMIPLAATAGSGGKPARKVRVPRER